MLGRSRRALGRLKRSSSAAGSPPSAGRPARRRPQRATPSNVIGEGPLVAAPGLDLGIVVIVRNEAPYLEEWLCYHLAVGVQHVFLYDNGSDDGLHEVEAVGVQHVFLYDNGSDDGLHELVDRYVNHGLVSVVHWPLPGGQIDAYSHALRFFGPSVEWLAFIDVDEFIVPLVDDDIPALLARWPDAADVRLPRVDFAFSGHRSPPPGLTIEAYT